jgi:S-adenosylmethionine:tRNA-ribosyltransferase-isomerase (queuine synthetase)
MILLHRPHPENEIKGGALKAVKQALKQEGFLLVILNTKVISGRLNQTLKQVSCLENWRSFEILLLMRLKP